MRRHNHSTTSFQKAKRKTSSARLLFCPGVRSLYLSGSSNYHKRKATLVKIRGFNLKFGVYTNYTFPNHISQISSPQRTGCSPNSKMGYISFGVMRRFRLKISIHRFEKCHPVWEDLVRNVMSNFYLNAKLQAKNKRSSSWKATSREPQSAWCPLRHAGGERVPNPLHAS